MKKFIILFASLILLSFSANARKSRVFVGLDYLDTQAKHEFYEKSSGLNLIQAPNQRDVSNRNIGVGASIGYRAYLKKFFVAPELFFDYLNSSSRDFYTSTSPGFRNDEIVINHRYGFKMNMGYNFYRGFAAYTMAGLTNVDFDIRWKNASGSQRNGAGVSYGSTKFAPIYGLGLSYDINPNITLRAAWDTQTFEVRYVVNGLANRVQLDTYRVGATLNF